MGRGVGQPVLGCNRWLEGEIVRRGTHAGLYGAWLARHRAAQGFDLVEPRRSFRAAVAGANRRLAVVGAPGHRRGGGA